jgi:hypothetical protein
MATLAMSEDLCCHTAAVDSDMTLLRVRNGEMADVGCWVYVWVTVNNQQRPVVYVGATGLPPAVRTWLHLHDSDPDVGRIAARYCEVAREDLDVLAFRVPGELSRRRVKAAVIQRLHHQGLLAEKYIGDLPDTHPPVEGAAEMAEKVVARVIAHGQAAGG